MRIKIGRAFALTFAVVALLPPAGALAANPGGVDPHPGTHAVAPSEEGCIEASGVASAEGNCGPVAKAQIVNGEAVAPAGAPPAVQLAIAAANRIRTKPYLWGGGHGRWWDRGYDCSGAVSFALHGGKLLSTPLDSTSFEDWGTPGTGRWISVYANGGHAYAVIAGLRWDTAGGADGPRWYKSTAAHAAGPFMVRHPAGY